MAPGAHQHPRFVFARTHHFRARSLHKYGYPVAGTMQLFLEGVHRHDHEVVLRLPKSTADALGDSDYLIFVGLGANGLADRIDVREKPFRHVGADEYHLRAVVVIGWGDKAALRHVDVAHLRIIRGNTHDIGVLQALVSGAHVDIVVIERGNRSGRLHAVAQALVINHSDERPLLRFHPGVLAGDNAKSVHDKHVGAQVRDAVGHVEVHAGNDAHHGHEGGYRQDHA